MNRDAALLFGDHSSRFFDMARYSAAKIIVRYHIGEGHWPHLRILMTFSASDPAKASTATTMTKSEHRPVETRTSIWAHGARTVSSTSDHSRSKPSVNHP
jgi:hypothetical protein